MSEALVTGATGLVGSHLVDRLVADGWTVRALVRSPDDARWLGEGREERVRLVRGDVLDVESLRRAAAGCDVIHHCAAEITPRGGWDAYAATNVQGTRNVIDAAASAGARLVQLSSVAVYGPSGRFRPDGKPTDEGTPPGPLPAHAWYARSKRDSEALVIAAHRQGRIWATAVRPCVIYGPRDRQFVPRVARLLSRGVAPLIGGGTASLPIVHAASVAAASALAAGTDLAGGRAYNVANDEPVSVRDFVRFAAEGLGRPVRLVPLPTPLARMAAHGAQGVLTLLGLGSGPAGARSSLDFLVRGNPFSSERARVELGWRPAVAPAVGVPAAFRWWRERAAEGAQGGVTG